MILHTATITLRHKTLTAPKKRVGYNIKIMYLCSKKMGQIWSEYERFAGALSLTLKSTNSISK
jgi:hypothetical protein